MAGCKVNHLFSPWLHSPGEEAGSYVNYHLCTWHPPPPPKGTITSPQPSCSFLLFFKLFPVQLRWSLKASPCLELRDNISSISDPVLPLAAPHLPTDPPLISSLMPLGAGRGGWQPEANIPYALPTSARESRSRVTERVRGWCELRAF